MRQQCETVGGHFDIDRAKLSSRDALLDAVNDESVAIRFHLLNRRLLLAPERFGFAVSEQRRFRLGVNDLAIGAYGNAKPLNPIRLDLD